MNKTNRKIVSEKVVFAKTVFEKCRGLMFCKRKNFDYALVFGFGRASKKSAAIHMFFVFFPIDVIYLRDNVVVDLYRKVMPFTPYLAPKTRADTLIELPEGTVNKGRIKIGDVINIR